MNMGCFPRLFVLLLALVIAVSFAGCEFDLPGMGGSSSYMEPANDEVMGDMVISGGDIGDDMIISGGDVGGDIVISGGDVGGDAFVIGGDVITGISGGDYSGYVNEEGCIVFDKLMSAEGVLQEVPLAIPANPDGTLMLPYAYQIIESPDGSLILFVEELSGILGDNEDENVDDGGYKLPNGDSVYPERVVELDDGIIHIDYDISHRFGGETYFLTDGTYASVSYHDEDGFNVSVESAYYARVHFVQWDTDGDYYNDRMIKTEEYRLTDKFVLSTMEYVYDRNDYDEMVIIAANAQIYDEYEQRYDHAYYEYDPRFGSDSRHRCTREIHYEGNTNQILWIYETDYNEYAYITATRNKNEKGEVTYETKYSADGNHMIVQDIDYEHEDGWYEVTDYENGKKVISNQYFDDGSKFVYYYEEDGTYAYKLEYDKDGYLTAKVFYDDEYNPTDAIYYDRNGNEIKK